MALFDWLSGDRTEQVRNAFTDLRFMLEVGNDMFAAAAGHLLDNEILEVDLPSMDLEINAREEHLRAAVLDHLSSYPNRQLAYVLKLFSIVQEAERIGDIAKTLARLAENASGPRMGPNVAPLRALRNQVLEMFEKTRTCFEANQPASANEVMLLHHVAKAEARRLVTDLANTSDMTVNEAVTLAVAARLIGRISSHLANIASTVVLPFEQIRRSAAETDEASL